MTDLPANSDARPEVDRIRTFNRFYTALLGVLDEGLLKTEFSLTEGRVLYELAQRDGLTAAELTKELGVDAAYLSRILRKFRSKGLVAATASARDGRERRLDLTEDGRAAFMPLEQASRAQVAALLDPLAAPDRSALLKAMDTIRSLLGAAGDAEPYVIRSHRSGDIGWIVHRHGVLYAQEYGFDDTFEALVAGIAGEFLKSHDPKREHCWIAERHGETVGSVTLVDAGDNVAKLRLLYVEPSARGLGIGARLVDECLRFAKRARYRRMTLWTNEIHRAACHIYEKRGFEMVDQERYHDFGCDLVSQTWERDL